MLKITTGPNCGGKKIKRQQRDWTGQWRGQCYTVPALEYYECLHCGERIYDREAMRKIEGHSAAFAKAVARK